ncbi:MAG: 16S rRNA (uracil(1498)-N(3))-methyltransferase [Burkholderiaceae bacterium]
MPRFFCNEPLEVGLRLTLSDEVARHIHVLRLAVDEVITLFNGKGGEYSATVLQIDKKQVQVELKSFSVREAEPAHALTLAQALPEGSKMDWIVEKAVELGATAIAPLAASRCVVKLSAERAEKKMQHWQGIIVAAAEQCGRNRLPHLAEPTNFTQWVGQQDLHRRILLSPRAGQSLSDWARHQPPQAVTIMIGPEGGFTDAEENAAIAHGALCLSMGERVLRTETAGLAAITVIQAMWGAM